jgi:endonuclease/exonuclease/phosphatase family metal-dependent hydrolase
MEDNSDTIGVDTEDDADDDHDSPSLHSTTDTEMVTESPSLPATDTLAVGAWNVNGLADYKQIDLLDSSFHIAKLDVLALCETYLVNDEQQVQWIKHVQAHNRYLWFGRPAVRLQGNGPGRGSGGVGVLIRSDWRAYATAMPPCEHDRLLFVRLQLPTAPCLIFIGVVYLVPVGSPRYDDNASLLDELEELTQRYRGQGAVCVMGDFNAHIADYPSTLLTPSLEPVTVDTGPLPDSEAAAAQLSRRSVDIPDSDTSDGVPSTGVAFVERMDSIGLVILNGLVDVGIGLAADSGV